MKLKYIILFILCALPLFAQPVSVSPSYYFTYGKYDDSRISRSHSAYVSWNNDYTWYPTFAFDNLYVNNGQWNYSQNMFIAGALYSDYPQYIKAYGAFFRGRFSLYPIPGVDINQYSYTDKSWLLAGDYSYYNEGFYFGGGISYMDAKGILTKDSLKQQKVLQTTLRIEEVISPELFVSIKPTHSYSSADGRSLFSTALKISYIPCGGASLKAGGFIGRRTGYFDSDLLTVFNQIETQKEQYFIQFEQNVDDMFTLSASAMRTAFDGYRIDYFVLGFKTGWHL